MSFEIRSFNESAAGSMDGPDDGVYTAIIKSVEDPEFWAFPESGLSAEEKAQGYILPCIAFPCSDVVVQQGYAD